MEIKLYDGNVHITFRELSHSYWYNNPDTGKKERLPGVTAYTSLLDKPNLIRWAVNCAIDHIKENLHTNNPLSLLEEARNKYEEIRKESAQRGNEIHKWIEEYIKENKVEMPKNENVVEAVTGLYNWISKEKVLESERVIFSKEHKFVGTLDLLIKRKGKTYLVDIKTGNGNKVYPEMRMQVAAYRGALEEEIGKIAGCIVLFVNKDTGEVTEQKVTETEKDYKAFLNLKEIYEWKKELDRGRR